MNEPRSFLDGRVVLHAGDCREVLRGLADNSVDSVCTDPPYSLNFMSKRWDDDVAFMPELWAEVLRCMKPGAHGLAMGGTRTFHRLVCAIEDAGAEIRDCIIYCFGSGFPKGLNVVNKLITLAICQSPDNAQLAVQCSKHILAHCAEERGSIAVALAQILPEGKLALLTEIGGAVALHEVTDMWPSEWLEHIGLNMTWSWRGSLDDACEEASKSIIGTPIEVIISLRIWNWLIGLRTSETIMPANVTLQNGLLWPAIIVEKNSIDCDACKNVTQIVSALGTAGDNPVIKNRGSNIALKPAIEMICMFRKPMSEASISANVLRWGTGAINIGSCRIPTDETITNHARSGNAEVLFGAHKKQDTHQSNGQKLGRWPANLIHDNSEEVLACFPETGGGHFPQGGKRTALSDNTYGTFNGNNQQAPQDEQPKFIRNSADTNDGYKRPGKSMFTDKKDLGGKRWGYGGSTADYFASFPQDDEAVKRIWYGSKADSDDRLGSKHPTIKPLALIQYLVRLVTPKGGTVLDIFAGTGTTSEAAFREGFKSIICEREAEYIKDIERRMSLVMEGPDTRAYASMKARNRPRDDGPLFGGREERQTRDNVKFETRKSRHGNGGRLSDEDAK
jgi:DNA modification methylase